MDVYAYARPPDHLYEKDSYVDEWQLVKWTFQSFS